MIGQERRSKERRQKQRRKKERRKKVREGHHLFILVNTLLLTVVMSMVGLLLMLYGDSFTNVLQEGWFLVLRQVSAVLNFIGM